MQFARDMDTELADKFIGMYVNKWTLGYGERGHKAVNEFLKRGVDAGLIPGPSDAEFLVDELSRRVQLQGTASIPFDTPLLFRITSK